MTRFGKFIGEKLECLLQKHENNYQLDREVCYDEKSPCVNNNMDKLLTNNNLAVGSSQYQIKYQGNIDYLQRGKSSMQNHWRR